MNLFTRGLAAGIVITAGTVACTAMGTQPVIEEPALEVIQPAEPVIAPDVIEPALLPDVVVTPDVIEPPQEEVNAFTCDTDECISGAVPFDGWHCDDLGCTPERPEDRPALSEQEQADVDAEGEDVIHEDDPRWRCRSMGNRSCGVQVEGTWYVIEFAPDGVTPAGVRLR